jgi:hypothetical protein
MSMRDKSYFGLLLLLLLECTFYDPCCSLVMGGAILVSLILVMLRLRVKVTGIFSSL